MFYCDTCQAIFTLKRNLTRHISEKHLAKKFWCCVMEDCESKCSRRYNLVNHLEKVHGISRAEALETALKSQPSTPDKGGYEDISEDDDALVQIIAEIENSASQPNTELQNRTIEHFDVNRFDETNHSEDDANGNDDCEILSAVSEDSLNVDDQYDDEKGRDGNNNCDVKPNSECCASGDSVDCGDSDESDACVDDRISDVSVDASSDDADGYHSDNGNQENSNADSLDYYDDLEDSEIYSAASAGVQENAIYEHMNELYDVDINSEPEDVVIISDADEVPDDGTIELPFRRRTEIFVLTFRRDTIYDDSGNTIDQSGSVEQDYFQYYG